MTDRNVTITLTDDEIEVLNEVLARETAEPSYSSPWVHHGATSWKTVNKLAKRVRRLARLTDDPPHVNPGVCDHCGERLLPYEIDYGDTVVDRNGDVVEVSYHRGCSR